ncbi:MAG: hypothetical protein AAFY72_16010, partial [Cyanobacteria bacterium J06649_4]
MKANLNFLVLKPSVVLSATLAALTLPILTPDARAQNNLSSEPTVICLYAADMGEIDPLGNQGFITAREVGGSTEFSFVSAFQHLDIDSAAEPLDRRVLIRSSNTLIFSGMSLDEAQSQLFTGDISYYNSLLGRPVDAEVTDEERMIVNENLDCSELTAAAPEDPSVPDGPTPNPDLDLSGLPDGNYRVVSASFPVRTVTDNELLEAGGAIFLFRKVGNRVTGTFGYIDQEGGSCVDGTLSGDRVTGDAYGYSDTIRSGVFLMLGEEVGENRYPDSALDLSSFSRINAGTRLPVTSCP